MHHRYLISIFAILTMALAAGPTSAATPRAPSTTPEVTISEHLESLDQVLQKRLRRFERRETDGLDANRSMEIERFERHLRRLETLVHRLGSEQADRLLVKIRTLGNRVRLLEGVGSDRVAPAVGRQSLKLLTPANDACQDAMPIGNGSFVGTTSGATNDGSASCGQSNATSDVWFKYSSPTGGLVFAHTLGSGYDTVLSVHNSCPGTAVNELTCSDDDLGLQSSVGFDVPPGFEAILRLSGSQGAEGPFVLNVGPAGAISGQVTHAVTGEPVADLEVRIYGQEGFPVAFSSTDPAGNYTATGLAAGNYFAIAGVSSNFIAELYDGLPCPDRECDPTTGVPIAVSLDTVTPGIDFTLDVGGTITGVIRETTPGSPIPLIGVEVFNAQGIEVASGGSLPSGRYTVGGLAAGTYFIRTRNSEYRDELYDDIPCPGGACDPTLGMPIEVSLNATVDGVDFMLDRHGGIFGVVTEAATGEPIRFIDVEALDESGAVVGATVSDFGGRYLVSGLISGSYLVRTAAFFEYQDELYDNVPCPMGECDPALGTPIAVSLEVVTDGIDFELDRLGTISGRVTEAATGEPIPFVLVDALDATGSFRGSGSTDANGLYAIGDLFPGDHFVRTSDVSQYLDELFDDIPCWLQDCDLSDGTPVAVSLAATTPDINFALDRLGSISGVVTETGSSDPIPLVEVTVYDTTGLTVGSGFNDDSGHYEVRGLAPGTYHARASRFEYQDELFDDIPCTFDSCDPATGTPIVVNAGASTQGVNFSLQRLGSISGVITEAATDEPLTFFQVQARDSQGIQFGFANTDNEGRYTMEGLPTGTYFVSTLGPLVYLNELYDDLPCPRGVCDPTAGTPIAVSLGVTTIGIDFALEMGGTLTGTVTDDAGSGLPDLTVVAFNPSASFVDYRFTDTLGRYSIAGLPAGSYFVYTRSFDYLDEVYDDLPCPAATCDPTTIGTPVAVSIGTVTSGIDFALESEATCVPSPTALCLNRGRFRAEAVWQDFAGGTGPGMSVELTGDTGYFWFFSPDNVELVIKVLNGCFAPFDSFWVFAAGLTDAGVELTVTDTITGDVRTYGNSLGVDFQPIQDTGAFPTCDAPLAREPLAEASELQQGTSDELEKLLIDLDPKPPSITEGPDEVPADAKVTITCFPNDTTLCLSSGRFEVKTSWQTPEGISGEGQAIQLTNDTGYFWFFSSVNIEAVVKVLDACSLDPFNNFWVFAAGLTDVEVTLRVTDTVSGEFQEWTNPQDTPFQPITETELFETCP